MRVVKPPTNGSPSVGENASVGSRSNDSGTKRNGAGRRLHHSARPPPGSATLSVRQLPRDAPQAGWHRP